MVPNLYTVDCPKCLVAEKKLTAKNIEFNKVYDFDSNFFVEKGFENLPILEIEKDKFLEYKEIIEWIREK